MTQIPNRRSEQEGILRFVREMASAFIMALIAIVYVIQAFKIPTGSMENSLLVGDFLLGLKFIYGAPVVPFSYKKLPAITSPKPGDVVIFKYPGADKKDYIKRCVAGPGQTVEIHGEQLIVDNKTLNLPPNGKYVSSGQIHPMVTDFAPLRIPTKGDIINPDTLPLREFLFFKHLVHQENPRGNVKAKFQLYLDGQFSNHVKFPLMGSMISIDDLNSEKLEYSNPRTGKRDYLSLGRIDDWTELTGIINYIQSQFDGKKAEIKQLLYIGDQRVTTYTVKYDNYFMMGDNRDNSMDSRYWGYLNRNFVKAKAFILYFSLDKDKPLWQLPLKIRWNRIGKLIRPWDGF